MSKKIHVGEGASGEFSLPIDAATQTFAFIARRGAGKTYAAGKLVEGFAAANVQFIVLDSVGNWWGLRVAADGKGRGIDVPLLGGLRGDIPLNPGAGSLIADIAVDSGKSLVLDISQFSKADRQRFATALGERLWSRKKGEESPSPIHIVIEESQLIVPENVGKDQTKMVGIYEEIIRLGRNYGIGCTLITQRPQSVNKEVLNQTECLFVLQVNGAHERKALSQWIVHQGMDSKIVNELPSLPQGTAYVWSPQWLGILEKVKVGKKWTFNSTATPKAGETRTGGKVKPIDLDDLKGKMAQTIQEAEANDPALLRKRIADLERAAKATPAAAVDTRVIDGMNAQVSLLDERCNDLAAQRDEANNKLIAAKAELSKVIESIHTAATNADAAWGIVDGVRRVAALPPTKTIKPWIETRTALRKAEDAPRREGINATQQRVLNAIAFLNSIGHDEPDTAAVGLLAGIDPTGGYFSNTVGPLSKGGLINRGAGKISLTDSGRVVADLPDTPRTLQGYHAALRECIARKTEASARLFDAIVEHGNRDITSSELGKAVQIDHTGGYFSNSIGPLGTLGLIRRRSGVITPTEILFPEGLR